MIDNRKNFESRLKLLARAEKELAAGNSGEAVCMMLSVEKEVLRSWADQMAQPPNYWESLNDSALLDAVFPIFAAETIAGSVNQIGSGVVVSIGEELFALTAAHVTDRALGDGVLFMPSKEGIVPMTGSLAYNPVSEHRPRLMDTGDMGYYHLSENWRTKLHPTIKPLSLGDLLLTDDLETGDLFTYVGYPWRLTKKRGGAQMTDRTTYTGHALSPDVYESLGLSRIVHVVIRMRLKKTYSTRHMSHKIAPHPQGISGGAVLAWPVTYSERLHSPKLKLAAIAHSFYAEKHCLVGTRIIPYMMAIVRNNPELAIHFAGLEACPEFCDFIEAVR